MESTCNVAVVAYFKTLSQNSQVGTAEKPRRALVRIVFGLGDEIMADISRIQTLEAPRSIKPCSEDFLTS
jgi:hypothetical protein